MTYNVYCGTLNLAQHQRCVLGFS